RVWPRRRESLLPASRLPAAPRPLPPASCRHSVERHYTDSLDVGLRRERGEIPWSRLGGVGTHVDVGDRGAVLPGVAASLRPVAVSAGGAGGCNSGRGGVVVASPRRPVRLLRGEPLRRSRCRMLGCRHHLPSYASHLPIRVGVARTGHLVRFPWGGPPVVHHGR